MVYLVLSSEYAGKRPVLEIAGQAIDAGIDILQMREKFLSEKDLMVLGEKLFSLCREKGIPFIVNDNPHTAKALNADGVHLGQEDIKRYSLGYSRSILGRDKIVGISTHSLAEFKIASSQDFDYIAFGPIFPTKTKDYHIGIDDIEEVLRVSSKPVIFIGGINISNIDKLIQKGVKNIAVIRAITEAENIPLAVKTLKKRFLNTPCLPADRHGRSKGDQGAFLIKINGKEQYTMGLKNLEEFICSKGLSVKAVVIEHNYNIIPKEKWHETIISKGDNIEIVSFVGGG
jgi:thiamine-phosphate pyrophosphorylase